MPIAIVHVHLQMRVQRTNLDVFRIHSSILIEPRMLKTCCKTQSFSSVIIFSNTEWFECLVVTEMNGKCQEILNFKCSTPEIRSDCTAVSN